MQQYRHRMNASYLYLPSGCSIVFVCKRAEWLAFWRTKVIPFLQNHLQVPTLIYESSIHNLFMDRHHALCEFIHMYRKGVNVSICYTCVCTCHPAVTATRQSIPQNSAEATSDKKLSIDVRVLQRCGFVHSFWCSSKHGMGQWILVACSERWKLTTFLTNYSFFFKALWQRPLTANEYRIRGLGLKMARLASSVQSFMISISTTVVKSPKCRLLG